jgi:predicted phage-related endonuclease
MKDLTEFTKHPVACEVYYPNIQSVSNEEYALIRRGGLGATDTSVMLGLMTKFGKDIPGLITEKLRTELSEEEKKISMLESVRKGRDLEDLILTKFAGLHNCEKPMKPAHMYKISKFPYLTVNFDGVFSENEHYVPVECKFVTPYGERNYNRNNAYEREFPEIKMKTKDAPTSYIKDDVKSMCEYRAAKVGIPAYYYAQVQHQLLALDSPYGYLAALHDKHWELVIYKIMRDDEVIDKIKIVGYQTHEKILKNKKTSG